MTMNRIMQLPLLLMLAIATVGCGTERPASNAEQSAAGTPAPRDTAPVATGGRRDDGFLREQVALSAKQVGLAQLAAERATRPAVKQLADRLLRDHRQAGEQLRQIASKQGGNVPADSDQLKVERERLSALSGEQFEREYLDEIIADHEDAVIDLEKAAKDNDVEIRQWAADNLTRVRRHLDEARQLRQPAGQKR